MSTIHSKVTMTIFKHVLHSSCMQKSTRNLTNLAKKRYKILQISKVLQCENRSKSTMLHSIAKGVNYSLIVAISISAGLLSGSLLVKSLVKKSDDPNEEARPVALITEFVPTKIVEHHESPYHNFPLNIHLYQFENCPYCSQIRAYLDYFGFKYTLTEVDPYSKEELTKFTKARKLPILVIEDRINKKKWHLANATSILSALESVRNEKHINFNKILDQYLPILRETGTSSPNKYLTTNSDLNSIEWRKWINNFAIPIFNLNSIDNLKNLFEKFDLIAEKSCWKSRYNTIKYYMVYYYNANKDYKKRQLVINRLDPEDQNKSPRELIDEVLTRWEQGLNGNKFISGTNFPNLADLSMYGNVRAYEGCTLFRESIAKYPKFREWYERMHREVLKSHKPIDIMSIPILIDDSVGKDKQEIISIDDNKDKDLVLEEVKPKMEEVGVKPDDNEKIIFRILSATYLIHVCAFAYAAYMNN